MSLWIIAFTSGGLWAAEYRTSVRGQPLVRRANYQQLAEPELVTEVAPLDLPSLAPSLVESPGPYGLEENWGGGGCDGPHWDGQCGPGFCPPLGCWSYWGSAEFLLWWRKGQQLPPLVTTGTLDTPGTQILYATETQSGDARPGARLNAGLWFSSCRITGFGVRLYTLGESTAHYDQDSDTVPVLARPFFNIDENAEQAVLIASPDSLVGSISIRNSSRVGGGDMFFRRLFFTDGSRRVDLIAGYQYSRIDTNVSIASHQQVIGTVVGTGTIPIGTTIDVLDDFDTRNTYSAGEIGLWGVYDRGPLTWSLLAKVGLGRMSQTTTISGRNTTINDTVEVTNQGLLALGTNSGVFERNVFAVSPELAFTGAYHLNDYIDLTFGYSFIYWNHVALAGDQIDLTLNPTQLIGSLDGAARPEFPARDTGFFVHGLNLGIQWVW